MAAQPSGTVTFLFVDIEGSTPLWDAHPTVMRDALARHDEIVASAIARYGGFVFSTGGDGFGVAFERPIEAVRAAVDAQRALQAEPWPDAVELRVRMGAHTGEAQERDGNYFGSAVNRAARVASAGHGGQILLSRATVELLEREDGVDLVDLGAHHLKGLSDAVQLFAVRAEGVARVDLAPVTVDTVTGNIPRAVTEYVGSATDLLASGDEISRRPLSTLTGPGGIGKTRTAIEIGAVARPSFADGAWFVDLAPIAEHAAVAAAVASTLGIRQRTGESTTESIVDWLRGRRLLLILDNCEHVIGPVSELVAAVMANCPGTSVLATSREPLGVPGERVQSVAALDSRSDASTLFGLRATAADASFDPEDVDRGTIEAICSRLDGLPLAIELAAARVRSLTPGDILERLDDRFRLLKSGTGSTGHHQTLRATVDWSYQLMSDEERTLFARLSVFAGGFDLLAAEAICADSESDRLLVDVLASLVDKSMVTAQRGPTGIRFRLLETLRQYGTDRLESRGEVESVRDRHLEHFVEVATRLATQWASRRQDQADAGFEREWDNIRAAFNWALTLGDIARADSLVTATGAHALSRIVHEHADWVKGALERWRAGGTTAPTASLFGWAAYWETRIVAGERRRAVALAEEGIAIARTPSDPTTAICWERLCFATIALGGARENPVPFRGAEAAMMEVSSPFERSKLLAALLEEAFSVDHSRAGERLAELTALADAVGAPWLLAEAAWARGRYLMWIHDPPDPQGALLAYEDGLDIARSAGDHWHENSLLVGLAYAYTALDSPSAPAACRDALTLVGADGNGGCSLFCLWRSRRGSLPTAIQQQPPLRPAMCGAPMRTGGTSNADSRTWASIATPLLARRWHAEPRWMATRS